MIHRTFDASAFNAAINHLDVRPWLGGKGELDVTAAVANPANFALALDGGGGGFLLIAHGGGVYEAHSQFVPEVRRKSIPAMRAGHEYMFRRTDCVEMVTKAPDDNGGGHCSSQASEHGPHIPTRGGLGACRRLAGRRGPSFSDALPVGLVAA